MKTAAFVGLGTMGLPMAVSLRNAGLNVFGFDINTQANLAFEKAGGHAAGSVAEAVASCDVVITMLPEGEHVTDVYRHHVLPAASHCPLLIDCSTIDVASARDIASASNEAGCDMLDAPVSGGQEGARNAALSFMVGGSASGFDRARPLLACMGKRIIHFGDAGAGQAAKACHNMICGITSVAVSESFALAERLGLDAGQFYELCAGAAAQSWILENRCPVPGVSSGSPSSNDYRPGFAAALMAKDLRLAQSAAEQCGLKTPFGAEAARLFTEFAHGGDGAKDFSAIYNVIRSNTEAD